VKILVAWSSETHQAYCGDEVAVPIGDLGLDAYWPLLKWFYDTSTGAATGAARCGSFVGKAFSLLIVSPR
jgi:hypothetical protein